MVKVSQTTWYVMRMLAKGDLTDGPSWCRMRAGRVSDPLLAHVAQAVEHALGKGEAMGSNPIVGSVRSEDRQ
jgi:hypothetical protein